MCGGILKYESDINFKNRERPLTENGVCVWGGGGGAGGFQNWPTREKKKVLELKKIYFFFENEDLFELHRSKTWRLYELPVPKMGGFRGHIPVLSDYGSTPPPPPPTLRVLRSVWPGINDSVHRYVYATMLQYDALL